MCESCFYCMNELRGEWRIRRLPGKKRAANLGGKQASNIYCRLSGAAADSDRTARVGRP